MKDNDINYILQIKAFYQWMEQNPISFKAITLWHGLMYLWNQCFWQENFTPAMSSITHRCGMSKAVVLRAREELISAGILTVEETQKRGFSRYILHTFSADFETLYKQNKTKQNKTIYFNKKNNVSKENDGTMTEAQLIALRDAMKFIERMDDK